MGVAVIGGVLGGVAAALCLLDSGIDVEVYEQTGGLREVGAGIQVSPNASRILHRLGLAEKLAAMGVRPLAFHQRRWEDGRTLLRSPLGDAVIEAFGFPSTRCTGPTCSQRSLGRSLPSGYTFATGSWGWPTTATGWWRPSTTERRSRPTCWSVPMASIRP